MLVPLSGGRFAIVDEADAEAVCAFAWSIRKQRTGKAYAVRGAGKGRSVYLHRFLWDLWKRPPAKTVDHENGDGLDCRWHNLRAATVSQNNSNAPKNRRNTSGYKGVSFDRCSGKWHARFRHLGKKLYAGQYATAEEAARAYDAAILPLRGEFAVLNFPAPDDNARE